MTQWVVLLLALWSARHREEPTRLECWRRLVAAAEPDIKPITRGVR